MGDREYLKSKILQNQGMPSLGTQAKNLGKSITTNIRSVLAGNSFRTSTETASNRLDICRDCPKYLDGRCTACGCFVNLKVTLVAEHCPLGKW